MSIELLLSYIGLGLGCLGLIVSIAKQRLIGKVDKKVLKKLYEFKEEE